MLTKKLDYGANGTVDIKYTFTYDANGNMLTVERDDGANGTVDGKNIYTYDCFK